MTNQPTQGEEFDWSEICLNLYAKFGGQDDYQKLLDFIKSHCVPREAWDVLKADFKVNHDFWVGNEKLAQSKLAAANEKLEAVRKWAKTWEIRYNSGDGVDFDELQAILTPKKETK